MSKDQKLSVHFQETGGGSQADEDRGEDMPCRKIRIVNEAGSYLIGWRRMTNSPISQEHRTKTFCLVRRRSVV